MTIDLLRVDFSLRKEIAFVTIGSILGAFTMHSPQMIFDLFGTSSYYVTLLVMSKVVNSTEPQIGFVLHLTVATIIGIVTGIFLHRIIKFDISQTIRGIVYGVVVGIIVFVIFAIPVSELLLTPNTIEVIVELDPNMTFVEATEIVKEKALYNILNLLYMHLIWGITLGIISSIFTRKLGANYRCHRCNIEFSNTKNFFAHVRYVHETPSREMIKILILGGGFGGVNVLKKIQEFFESDVKVSIDIVSESNFLLHTPMLPEMATGIIEPRHIATPIRNFCKRARFHQGIVQKINLKSKKVTIIRNLEKTQKTLSYDYLILSLGSKTNFFDNENIKQHSLTIKTLDDAIKIRNHVITVLEEADQESNPLIQSHLTTFIVVGGGFSGVETVGELNDFVRESCEKFYRNIDPEHIKIILVAAGEKILPEIGDLGDYVKKSLEKSGVEFLINTKLENVINKTAILSNGKKIPFGTLIWAGGIKTDNAVYDLEALHHKDGRLVTDKFLRICGHSNVFALGDCAYVINPKTSQSYPPTAQHAIRQAKIVSLNLIRTIQTKDLLPFAYNTKGTMAKIGKKNGVALLMGFQLHGFLAWFVWKLYYLSTLPTFEKRLRVAVDWFIDLFFPRDITRLSSL